MKILRLFACRLQIFSCLNLPVLYLPSTSKTISSCSVHQYGCCCSRTIMALINHPATPGWAIRFGAHEKMKTQPGLGINSVKLLCVGRDDCFPGPQSLISTNSVRLLLLVECEAHFRFILGITGHITVGKTLWLIWHFSLFRRAFSLPVDLQ